jgi:hypothetical protein
MQPGEVQARRAHDVSVVVASLTGLHLLVMLLWASAG